MMLLKQIGYGRFPRFAYLKRDFSVVLEIVTIDMILGMTSSPEALILLEV